MVDRSNVDNTVEIFMNIPEPHPAKEFCEKHGFSISQVARRILRSEEETKQILNGVVKPISVVEERLQNLMRTYG
jgi:hypothetical protein